MDGHLVPVKVGIVGFTDKWVQAKGLTINQDWLEAWIPNGEGSVRGSKALGCFFDHFFKDIPDTLISVVPTKRLAAFDVLHDITG